MRFPIVTFGKPMNATRDDRAAKLVAQTRAAGGLAPVDLPQFWADQDRAMAHPFGTDIPQVPLGVLMSRECVFAELDIPRRRPTGIACCMTARGRRRSSRAYNDKAEQIVEPPGSCRKASRIRSAVIRRSNS